MKAYKWAGIGVLTLFTLALVAPYLIGFDGYRKQLEEAAAARLGQPVGIRAVRIEIIPVPRLTASDIVVGTGADLHIDRVSMVPELTTLWAERTVLREFTIEHPIMTPLGLNWLAAKDLAAPGTVKVAKMRVEDALIKLQGVSVGPLDMDVNFDERNAIRLIEAKSRDGKLQADIRPEPERVRLDLRAQNWTLPIEPRFTFETLRVQGVATESQFLSHDIRANFYGGTIDGTGAVSWSDGVALSALLSVRQVDLEPLSSLLKPGAKVTGRLDARPVFSAKAANMAGLADTLRVETPFSLERGVLYGVDIADAATVLLKQAVAESATPFDRMTGQVVFERGAYRLADVSIASSGLAATAQVTVSEKNQLAGRIDANVRAAHPAAASVPLVVSGTVREPMLLPTGTFAAAVPALEAAMRARDARTAR